jgi:hypothetical protein
MGDMGNARTAHTANLLPSLLLIQDHLHLSEKFGSPDAKCQRKMKYGVQRRAFLSSLELAYVVAMKANVVGKSLL